MATLLPTFVKTVCPAFAHTFSALEKILPLVDTQSIFRFARFWRTPLNSSISFPVFPNFLRCTTCLRISWLFPHLSQVHIFHARYSIISSACFPAFFAEVIPFESDAKIPCTMTTFDIFHGFICVKSCFVGRLLYFTLKKHVFSALFCCCKVLLLYYFLAFCFFYGASD